MIKGYAPITSILVGLVMLSACKVSETCYEQSEATNAVFDAIRRSLAEDIPLEAVNYRKEGGVHYFFVEGVGEYARPGFHWSASVNAETCEVYLKSGE